MSYQKHCPGCFRRKDGNPVCAHCGYDESAPRSPLFLPHGSVLAGQYRVGKVLGRPGGFGITYLGWDIYLQQRVAIKEYLPPEMAVRVPDALHITVHTSDDRKNFEAGKDQFLREARIVARLDHPNVVRVRAFFNANDTAYMVMDYYEGMSLDAYFGQVKPTLDMGVAASLVQMILDGLSYVHERGVVHRDVKPHNIYLAAIGKPILLDFGAARKNLTGQHRSVSVVLTEGYAPLEQYQRNGEQGPWTDIYGAAATLYRMVTGRAPPVAIDRMTQDPLEKDDYAGVPDPLKPVLRKGLALNLTDRYQSAAEFRAALAGIQGLATSSFSHVSNPGVVDMARASTTPRPAISRSVELPSQSSPHPKVRILPPALAAEAGAVSPIAPLPAAPANVPPPKAMHSPAASPEAAIRTRSTTVPSAILSRWAVPAVITAGLAASLFVIVPKLSKPAADQPATRAGGVEVAETSASTPRYAKSGLPALSAEAIPPLRTLPAGVYARSGAAALQLPSFRIGETEVTVAEFATFIDRSGYNNPAWLSSGCAGANSPESTWRAPGYTQTESHPVVCVSWDDAKAYTEWLSEETQRQFRLPTEAEWEYAAAAGSASNYWWGNVPLQAHAACLDCGRPGMEPTKPLVVTSLGQNNFGLYGTAGNVREWTCSPSAAPLSQACALAGAPEPRIVRGGSWRDPAIALTTTYRSVEEKPARTTWIGFRVVEDLNR